MDISTFIIVFGAGIAASFIAGAAGGGSLISTPILMLLGYPPHLAIGTNKMGALGATGMSFFEYHKAGKIPYKIGIPILFIIVFASVLGAITVMNIEATQVSALFGMIMLVIAGLVILDRQVGLGKRKISKKNAILGAFLFVPIGILGGALGAGQGLVAIYVLVSLFGLSFLEGNGVKSFAAFFVVAATAAIFALNGMIDYEVGAVLFVSMLIGSKIGARTALKKGDSWVKNLFIVLVFVLALKLLFF